MAGWGFTNTERKIVNELQRARVPFVDLKKCKHEWQKLRRPITLPDDVICAGGYKTEKGFCKVCLYVRKCHLMLIMVQS